MIQNTKKPIEINIYVDLNFLGRNKDLSNSDVQSSLKKHIYKKKHESSLDKLSTIKILEFSELAKSEQSDDKNSSKTLRSEISVTEINLKDKKTNEETSKARPGNKKIDYISTTGENIEQVKLNKESSNSSSDSFESVTEETLKENEISCHKEIESGDQTESDNEIYHDCNNSFRSSYETKIILNNPADKHPFNADITNKASEDSSIQIPEIIITDYDNENSIISNELNIGFVDEEKNNSELEPEEPNIVIEPTHITQTYSTVLTQDNPSTSDESRNPNTNLTDAEVKNDNPIARETTLIESPNESLYSSAIQEQLDHESDKQSENDEPKNSTPMQEDVVQSIQLESHKEEQISDTNEIIQQIPELESKAQNKIEQDVNQSNEWKKNKNKKTNLKFSFNLEATLKQF